MAEPKSAQRNPPWSRDELILALDFYLTRREHIPGKKSVEIAELSAALNQMARALGANRDTTYRNPNGVYMKLMNFRRFDPEYTKTGKVGLQRGNRLEEEVWDDFASDRQRLSSVASAIKAIVQRGISVPAGQHEDDVTEAEEGRLLAALHQRRERNRKLVDTKKRQVLQQTGRLQCEVCGFDFESTYGKRGSGFIECHHIRPVHTLTEGHRTNLDDLALLCSNCHRMVHAERSWLSVDELKAILSHNARPRHTR